MLKNQCEVEVLVNGKPLKEFYHEGKTYVEGRKETRFSLRLRNNSGSRKLFVPSIDGLSVMNGEEASFDSSGYIVRPYSAVTIDGWRISDNDVAEFFFSSPEKSYRKRMEKGNNLGVIGVAVFDEKERQSPPIVIEKIVPHHCHGRWCNWCGRFHDCCNGCSGIITYSASSFGAGTTSVTSLTSLSTATATALSTAYNAMKSVSQDLGTGWGETKRSEVTTVEFERQSNPSATFEIYYNTREQLEALGVNLTKESVQVAPQAFPGQYCKPPTNN